jgi:dolichol-phosphate mannosyltransferase
MKLSVIIPVYNEEKTLTVIIKKVEAISLEKEIIIVDDGSTDRTPEILQQYKHKKNFTILTHRSNQGKGMAVRSGIKHVAGDITIIQDADLEYDPKDYMKLIEPMRDGKELVIYGARRPLGLSSVHLSSYLAAKFLSFLTNILYKQKLTDEPTCYKVFDSNLLKSIVLRCKGFEFDPEITAKVARRGITIKEIPVSYYPRKFTEGKKIRLIDGIIAVWVLLRYRFVN